MNDKIVIFGAGGRFNQILVPQLLAEGYDVRAVDIVPMDYDCECIQATTEEFDVVVAACKGRDIVINAAGLHYLPRGTDHPENYPAYWETNFTGTHNIFLAALRTTVRKIIFSSSVVYYDLTRLPGVVNESWPATRPAGSIYDLSKVVGEDICRFYAHGHGIETIALRYGNFCGDPKPGFDFLFGRMRREDAAQANRLAINYTPEHDGFEAFNILAGCPFQPEDVPELERGSIAVLEKYYPGIGELMAEHHLEWAGQPGYFSIESARRKLGYKPEYTFETFVTKLAHRPKPMAV